MPLKKFGKMIDVFIPYPPRNFRQRGFGIGQGKFRLCHSSLNNIIDG